jgi:hypothetical protein
MAQCLLPRSGYVAKPRVAVSATLGDRTLKALTAKPRVAVSATLGDRKLKALTAKRLRP